MIAEEWCKIAEMNAASTGEAAKLRAILMKDVGMKKKDRFSWIYAKNSIHIFQAKDTTHERYPEIQAMLAKLKRDMKPAGGLLDNGKDPSKAGHL
ncbi:hypothetical protein BC332_02802 [Capsicum chinense]|nr:hypothetical protein BC332_02802 [Capsicum chinense]